MSQELVQAGHPSSGKAEVGGHRKRTQDELIGSGEQAKERPLQASRSLNDAAYSELCSSVETLQLLYSF